MEWISVKDKLPGPFETVLVTVKSCNGYGEPAAIVEIGGQNVRTGEWETYCNTTHKLADGEEVVGWMPLPAPCRFENLKGVTE